MFPWTWDFAANELKLSKVEEERFAYYRSEMTRHVRNYAKRTKASKVSFRQTALNRIQAQLHVASKNAPWHVDSMFCGDADSLFVRLGSSDPREHRDRFSPVFQVPLRLAVTLPQFQIALPFFMLNFVSLAAFKQHGEWEEPSRDCFTPKHRGRNPLRPVKSKLWHDKELRKKLELLIKDYETWGIDKRCGEERCGEDRTSLELELEALLERDFSSVTVSSVTGEEPATTRKRKVPETASKETASKETPPCQQEGKSEDETDDEAEAPQRPKQGRVRVQVEQYQPSQVEILEARLKAAETQLEQMTNLARGTARGFSDLRNRYEEHETDGQQAAKRARDFRSSEFEEAFRARLQQELPNNQTVIELTAQIEANAAKTRELQSKFEEDTKQFHAEFVVARQTLGDRVLLVEQTQELEKQRAKLSAQFSAFPLSAFASLYGSGTSQPQCWAQTETWVDASHTDHTDHAVPVC